MIGKKFIPLLRGCEIGNEIMLAVSFPLKIHAFLLDWKFLRSPR